MRTLPGNLETNQKNAFTTYRPILCKIVLTKTGLATQTYDVRSTTNRIWSLSHAEQEWSQIAHIAVGSDSTLAALDLKGYLATISYGYNDATNGDEYSACAPLEVVAQNSVTDLLSRQSTLMTYFTCAGIFDLMAADEATAKYTQTDTDTQTVKTLLTAIAQSTLAPFTTCKAYTITFDSEDSLIDSYIPKDYFYVAFGESRLSAFKKLIQTTKCIARIEDDGQIHIFYPKITGDTWAATTAYVLGNYVQPTTANDYTYECTTAGTSGGTEPTWPTTAGNTVNDGTAVWTCRDYDYEYNDAATNHNFFSKRTRKRLVIPNKIIVSSHPDHATQYTGNATDSASYAALDNRYITEPKYIRATSNAECTNIATAMMQHLQVGAEKGHGSAPMNCGQEVMDYVKITDSIASDTRTGNIGYLRRDYIPGRQFSSEFGFGKIAQELPFLSPVGGDGQMASTNRVTYQELFQQLNSMQDWFYGELEKLASWTIEQQEVMPKLHVTEQLIIPCIVP